MADLAIDGLALVPHYRSVDGTVLVQCRNAQAARCPTPAAHGGLLMTYKISRRRPSSIISRGGLGVSLIVLLACCGCGSGPTAHRIRPDTNDRYYPQRAIHFVEHGQRSTGVLVAATPGFESAFSATWVTMLVPTPPTRLAGPVWTDRSSGPELAREITELPRSRDAFYVGLYGESARFRFRADAVWVLGTDPFIVALPAGAPRRTWREFAETATGVRDSSPLSPLDPFVVRYVVDEELDQPLARLVVFPPDFWQRAETRQNAGGDVSVVTLPKPLSVADALDALASGGDPLRLGVVEAVALQERFASDVEAARARLADRERQESRGVDSASRPAR